jgi:hypothetical protein
MMAAHQLVLMPLAVAVVQQVSVETLSVLLAAQAEREPMFLRLLVGLPFTTAQAAVAVLERVQAARLAIQRAVTVVRLRRKVLTQQQPTMVVAAAAAMQHRAAQAQMVSSM